MKISTKLHTVFITVGPSMCGKSTFANAFAKKLIRQLNNTGSVRDVVHVISSDEERQSVMQLESLHRYAPLMAESSENAFNVLMAKFKAAITFPTNSQFVIIDTTGMNDTFRKEIRKLATENEYRTELITFEYPNYEYWSQSNSHEKTVVQSSAKRFKQSVLPNLGRKDHDGCIRVRERDENRWADLEVEIEDLELFGKCHLWVNKAERINIIGDIHEHVDALDELLVKLSADSGPVSAYVLVGDYIDKGNDTAKAIDAARRFSNAGGIIVHGNHESYAVKRIKGEIKNPDLVMESKYMSSLDVLLKDEALAAELVDLFDNHSVPFLKIEGPEIRTVYVTHAPCENKYLGKMNSYSLKAQRNLYGDRSEDYRKAYEFIFKEAVGNHPLHVFGHVAHSANKLEFRNKIFIDTGAVYGGKLTAFCYTGNRYWFESVQAEERVTVHKDLQNFLTAPIAPPAKPFSIHDYKLEKEDLRFLKRTLANNIRYISGTMAPAPSTNSEIESLEAGLKYFKEKGVEEVIVEPKYMGSRCQMYLYREEPAKDMLVSRGGFKIRMTEKLQEMIGNVRKDMEEAFPEEWKDELILDGELLPWTTLGASLVEEQFRAYEELVRYELDTLSSDAAFNELVFKQKPDLVSLQADLKTYSETLGIYAAETDPYYKPFAILKLGRVNDFYETAHSFTDVSDDEYAIVNLDEAGFAEAKKFFDKKTVSEKMEGVVIKPLDPIDGVAPYMKVRNENYLTLVYGYDYKRRYDMLCAQKRVGGKLKVSIKEHELATQMLKADNGPALTELIVKMISQMHQEKTLDPRL